MDSIEHVSQGLLGPEKAPDSLAARYGLLAWKGVCDTPAGIKNAIVEDINHPLQTVGMVAGAAAVGAVMKTLLPRAGTVGKTAGLIVGAYAIYKASEPIVDSFTIAKQAKTMNDINVAGRLLGDVTGSFLVNTALSGAAYKLGSMGAEHAFSLPRVELPPVAVANESEGMFKPNFWSRAVVPRVPFAVGITTASATSMIFEPRLASLQKFTPSEIGALAGQLTGPTDSNKELSITVQLKSKASDIEMEQALKNISLGRQPNMGDAEFAERFGPSKDSFEQLTKFAENYGLKIAESDLRSGRVVLKGTAKQFSEAFRTQLNEYRLNGQSVRERSGAVFVPKTVARNIEGVFGLDDHPRALPHNTEAGPALDDGSRTAYRADEVAQAYNFPKGTTGRGQSAAIVELGGGIDMENESAYYKANGLKVPDISIVKLHDVQSNVGRNPRADQEVSLDSQVLGTIAPDAKQMIIFAKNSEQGFIDAIARGTFPEKNESSNQAISISWGQPFESMSEQGKRGMDLALKKAALKGISVFVAAGDDGANDNVPDGKMHVDFPAANPFVTGVGGTTLTLKDGKIQSEVAWNDSRGTTGGGISPEEAPEYQKDLKLSDKPLSGRGVPDLAGNASFNTGYKIRSNGADIISGGTSAVAPLYASLALRLNEGLSGTRTVGFMNPFLYQQGISANPTIFNDVTSGNNKGYEAGKGWDPVTGWGSLNGEKLLEAYKQAAKSP